MQLTAFNLLIGIALIFAILALIKPAWPLLPLALILVCVALLVGRGSVG